MWAHSGESGSVVLLEWLLLLEREWFNHNNNKELKMETPVSQATAFDRIELNIVTQLREMKNESIRLSAENESLKARIAVVEAERNRMRAELEIQEYEDQIETLQYIVDHAEGKGDVSWWNERDPQGFWLVCEAEEDEDEEEAIYLGKDFDEAHKVLEERREAYIDAYWGDALPRK